MRLYDELIKPVEIGINEGIEDDGEFTYAVEDILKVMNLIKGYVNKHGNIALSCGGEWMYQDDNGQVDALELVSDILDSLSEYANEDEED